MRTGFLVSWLTALIFCLRDLETVVTVYPPGRETLMVRLFTVMANSPAAVVAALATLQVLLILLPVAALLWVWSRRGGQERW